MSASTTVGRILAVVVPLPVVLAVVVSVIIAPVPVPVPISVPVPVPVPVPIPVPVPVSVPIPVSVTVPISVPVPVSVPVPPAAIPNPVPPVVVLVPAPVTVPVDIVVVSTEASEVVRISFLFDAILGWVNVIAQAGTRAAGGVVIALVTKSVLDDLLLIIVAFHFVYALGDILESACRSNRCQQDSTRDSDERDDLHV